jgi:hypothetical protein
MSVFTDVILRIKKSVLLWLHKFSVFINAIIRVKILCRLIAQIPHDCWQHVFENNLESKTILKYFDYLCIYWTRVFSYPVLK